MVEKVGAPPSSSDDIVDDDAVTLVMKGEGEDTFRSMRVLDPSTLRAKLTLERDKLLARLAEIDEHLANLDGN